MAVFFLDRTPELCAEYIADRHLNKTILFTISALSTAHRLLDGIEYKEVYDDPHLVKRRWKLHDRRDTIMEHAKMINRPIVRWMRESLSNYNWGADYLLGMFNEYNYRFDKSHKKISLCWILGIPPSNIIDYDITPPFLDEIETMRVAYKTSSLSKMNRWTKRDMPAWMV